MEQTEEAATETKAKSSGSLRLIDKSRIIQSEFFEGIAEIFKPFGIGWI